MFVFATFQRLYLAGDLKYDFLVSGVFHPFYERFPLQLIVHTGSGFKGFTREQDFAKFPKIRPKWVDIPISSKFWPIFGKCAK